MTIVVKKRNIIVLILTASLRLKKSTMRDMMIMTADKGFAIAVFIPALLPDMVLAKASMP